ncbi:succinate dehydrogenase, hydrophobic membrane anchor protein [Pseudoroseicyclus tamaricis]|uniref:Succinate dehydrogenase hydrophobic membrane anchor subunit n=1 Tax=Pseudoroseicyclus tamaricis TaxID=2705421 RepID=A0A6B2JFV7_9RHOB|nr:succinate dehydrogenase, hydrophobic membrane anchor protein [Pseudoroseicyclus tamaricis]NDU99962.1 succinate dehydrogenase, hydrophobic membrane anchor protein [Pseudoroseicyclus tamaricis]
MAYMTDRKRANGLGSAHSGAHHHWQIIVSSVVLLVLVPLFVFTFGRVYGEPFEVALIYMSRPFPAVVAGLTILVGFYHFAIGARSAVEDYLGGWTRKLVLIGVNFLCLALAGYGLFAIARLALLPLPPM